MTNEVISKDLNEKITEAVRKMQKKIIQIPEVEEMYDAVIQGVLPDYGTGGIKFTHAIVTEGGRTLRMSGFPAISKKLRSGSPAGDKESALI